jgi:hypothetical protein
VQIDADILCWLFHGSLLLSSPVWFRHPKCAAHTWPRGDGGLPPAFRHGPIGLCHAPGCHEISSSCRRPSRCAHRSSSRGSCAALLHDINHAGY